MEAIMTSLQRLGRALMGAVAVMPVAALLMGIGYWIDPTGWGNGNILALVLITSGKAVLDNLGVIFAIAVAFGLSKESHGAAALSGWLGFMTVTTLLNKKQVAVYQGHVYDDLEKVIEQCANYKIVEEGIDCSTLSAAEEYMTSLAQYGWEAMTGGNVFVGISSGILAAWTYNRFSATKLPDFLAFFSGRRLVPILTSVFSIALSFILYFVWPLLYFGLVRFGDWIQGLGPIGAGIYGFFNRLLIPTGLHHALNQVFWFDLVGINDIGDFLGGQATIESAAAAKDAASCPGVWNAGTSTCEVVGYVGMYQAGFFPVMMFGLPAAALAIYLRAEDRRKKVVGSLMMAGALSAFFTGVTEPLEFAFMFVAPVLYLIHALLTGLSLAVASFFNWTSGFGFSAGFVDMALSARNPVANEWWMLILQGVVWAIIYFLVFYYLIPLLKLPTPGRETEEDPALVNDDEEEDADLGRGAALIIEGLGGVENIDSLEHCATRLRAIVRDPDSVDESRIRQAGIAGIIRPSKKGVQVVIGPQVQMWHDEVSRQMALSPTTEE